MKTKKKLTKVAWMPHGQVYQMGPRSFLASARLEGQRQQKYFPEIVQALEFVMAVERQHKQREELKQHMDAALSKVARLASRMSAAEQEALPDAVKDLLEPYAGGATVMPAFTRKKAPVDTSTYILPQVTAAPQPRQVAQIAEPATVALPSKPIMSALDEYIEDIKPYLAATTWRDYRNYLKRLPAELTVRDIDATVARAWLKTWEGKTTSCQAAMRALSAFWNWCAERDLCDQALNPCNKLGSVRRQLRRAQNKRSHTIDVWTPAEAEAVYRKAVEIDPRIRGWFIVCTWLGVRPAEAMRLDQSDFHGGALRIPPEKAKSAQGRNRLIEFTGPLEAVGKALANVDWFQDGRLVPWTQEKEPGRVVTKAIKALGMHRGHDVMRHTCASYLSVLVGEDSCSKLLGHSVEIERQHYNARASKADAEAFYSIKL